METRIMKAFYLFLAIVGGIAFLSLYMRCKENPNIFYVEWLPFGFNGLMIPPFGVFILEKHKQSEELQLHELVHWKQYQRQGLVRFIIGYAFESIKGYDANQYEIEARYRESDFCKSNYTYCIKNGLAKTVHNPNFRK